MTVVFWLLAVAGVSCLIGLGLRWCPTCGGFRLSIARTVEPCASCRWVEAAQRFADARPGPPRYLRVVRTSRGDGLTPDVRTEMSRDGETWTAAGAAVDVSTMGASPSLTITVAPERAPWRREPQAGEP